MVHARHRSSRPDTERPMTFSCKDCPPGNEVTDHVFRVQRKIKHYDADRRLVAVDIIEGEFDYYCVQHYQERVDADKL